MTVPALLALGHFAAHTLTAAGGDLTGCVTDKMATPVPGVNIDVSGGGVRKTVETNAAGYEIENLPPGLVRDVRDAAGFRERHA